MMVRTLCAILFVCATAAGADAQVCAGYPVGHPGPDFIFDFRTAEGWSEFGGEVWGRMEDRVHVSARGSQVRLDDSEDRGVSVGGRLHLVPPEFGERVCAVVGATWTRFQFEDDPDVSGMAFPVGLLFGTERRGDSGLVSHISLGPRYVVRQGETEGVVGFGSSTWELEVASGLSYQALHLRVGGVFRTGGSSPELRVGAGFLTQDRR